MKILLIEDDAFFQKFYAAKLNEKGYEVEQAEDGVVGLEKAKSFKPDIILLDLIMPRKDGFEVLQGLAADQELKNIPVLVFSTLGQDQDIERAKQLGAKEYVNKSFFDFDNLVSRIEALHKGEGSSTQPPQQPQAQDITSSNEDEQENKETPGQNNIEEKDSKSEQRSEDNV